MKDVFIRPEIACKMLKVTNETLKRWAGTGKIQFIKTPGGHRRYNIDGFLNLKNDFLKHPTSSNQNSLINNQLLLCKSINHESKRKFGETSYLLQR